MSITVLPPEMVLRVADNLQPEDVVNLAQTSKQLAYIIEFTGLCKKVLMVSTLRTSISWRRLHDASPITRSS